MSTPRASRIAAWTVVAGTVGFAVGTPLGARAAVAGIHGYQQTVAPLLQRAGVRCRFTPTCSHYAEVVIARDAAAIDAVTGEPAGAIEAGGEAVRLNNRLRGAIRGALGRLMIFSPEPEERLAAAIGVYKTRSVENLPLLEKALAVENDPRVRAQLQISLAATQVLSPEQTHRLAGVATLARSSDTEARAILLQLAGASDVDDELRQAAVAAIASVDSRLAALRLVQTVFQGLSLGSVLLLAAMGLALLERGAIPDAPIPLVQSVLIVWPQIVGLVAGSILLFVIAYIVFQRQEVRA